jgi:predicted lipoprotein with Yx(FWY)xxD motif
LVKAIRLVVSRRALFLAGLIAVAAAGLAIAKSATTNVHLGKTTFGPYVAQRLQDGHGYPIYVFTHDQRDKSRCSNSCALQFTPLTTQGHVKAWNGVKQKLLGIIERGHGVKQVTYDHHPLYTATTDTRGSAVADGCLLYKGRWYVVDKTAKADKRWNMKCTGGY